MKAAREELAVTLVEAKQGLSSEFYKALDQEAAYLFEKLEAGIMSLKEAQVGIKLALAYVKRPKL